MRKLGFILAAMAFLAGSLWSLQGAGLVGGSFMTGSSKWLWIGVATASVGLVALAALFRAGPRS